MLKSATASGGSRLLAQAFLFALAVVLAAASTSSRAGAEPSVRAEREDQTLRLMLEWREGVDYDLTQTGTLVVVRFSRPVDQSFDSVLRGNPDVFTNISIRGEQRVVVFRLRREFRVRHREVGHAVLVEFRGVGAAAAEEAAPATVELSLERADEGVQRLIFDWGQLVQYRFVAEERRATIIFRRRAILRLGRGARRLSRAGVSLTAVPTGDSLSVTLVFERDVNLRIVEDDSRIIVEAVPRQAPRQAGQADDAEAAETRQRLRGETVDVRVERGDDGPVLVFDWPAKVSAAAFRRSNYIWLVFGPTVRLDLSAARDELRGEIDDMEQLVSDHGTVLRLRAGSSIKPVMERRNWEWRITLLRGAIEEDRPSMTLTPDPEAQDGRGEVAVSTGQSGPVLNIPDPDIGDMLIVVPVDASGWGVERTRVYPTFRILASAQGLVVEPRGDGIFVTASGQDVRIRGSVPLYLSPASQ